MSEPTTTWLYAIVPGFDTSVLVRMTGVADERLRLVEVEGLAAIVGSVPSSDFDEEGLRGHLDDLRWLESSARAHHRVIETASREVCTLPLRFATVYHDDGRVQGLLQERREDFRAALARLIGRTEWGVKVFVDPEALTAAPRGEPQPGAKSGTAYLLEKRARQQRQDDAQTRAAAYADEVHTALAALAAHAVQHPPQDATLAGYRGWMMLNASYLVDDARTDEFGAAVAALGKRFPGVHLELSGPWPAYSFAGAEEG